MGAHFSIDRSVPGLVVKIGDYPLHHGGVGAIRSLGRLGVPMYAITEDRWTPAARSRYLREPFVWPTSGREPSERLLAGLLRAGRRIGRPAVLIPTDEEAAVLIAEHQRELREWFLFPRVEPELPRRLASKQGLHELCGEHGVPSPASSAPGSYAEVERFAGEARFPVVAKNREAFVRRESPAVNGTTRIEGPGELLALARGWGERPGVILQEYLPLEEAEDWIVHAYCGPEGEPLALFTGVKVRSWPPHAGMTAAACVVGNPELAALTAQFVKRLGFAGIIDLDWRFDRRDGRYKLLDFNPRMGAQFRLFESEAGVDVVRAQHLDLTGRAVPEGEQRDGRRYVVENIDPVARLAYRRRLRFRLRFRSGLRLRFRSGLRGGRGPGYRTPHVPARARGTELAWAAPDDPVPAALMAVRLLRPGVKHLWQWWRGSHG